MSFGDFVVLECDNFGPQHYSQPVCPTKMTFFQITLLPRYCGVKYFFRFSEHRKWNTRFHAGRYHSASYQRERQAVRRKSYYNILPRRKCNGSNWTLSHISTKTASVLKANKINIVEVLAFWKRTFFSKVISTTLNKFIGIMQFCCICWNKMGQRLSLDSFSRISLVLGFYMVRNM